MRNFLIYTVIKNKMNHCSNTHSQLEFTFLTCNKVYGKFMLQQKPELVKLYLYIENKVDATKCAEHKSLISLFVVTHPSAKKKEKKKKRNQGPCSPISAVCSHALSWTHIDLLRNEEEENQ